MFKIKCGKRQANVGAEASWCQDWPARRIEPDGLLQSEQALRLLRNFTLREAQVRVFLWHTRPLSSFCGHFVLWSNKKKNVLKQYKLCRANILLILSSNLPLFHRLLCYKIALTLFSKTKRQIRRVEARYILYSRMEKSFLSQNTRAGHDLKSSGTIIIFRKKKKKLQDERSGND
jgi:hypothetical protein